MRISLILMRGVLRWRRGFFSISIQSTNRAQSILEQQATIPRISEDWMTEYTSEMNLATSQSKRNFLWEKGSGQCDICFLSWNAK
jgi:hypothetical protein